MNIRKRIKTVLTLAAVLGIFAAFSGTLQAAETILEQFDYTPGALGGASGGAGFDGAWATTSNSGNPLIEVKDGGLPPTIALDVAGNSVYRTGSAGRAEANRVISAASQTALLADGSTIWFSVLYQQTGSNNSAFLVATDTFDVAATGTLTLVAAGEGFGFGTPSAATIQALAFDDSTTPTTADSGISASDVKLIAGKITWDDGADSDPNDILELYNVTDLTSEPITPIATVIADLDQSLFDLVVLQHNNNTVTFDEIRIGATFADVAPVTTKAYNPTPSDGEEDVECSGDLELSWTNADPMSGEPNDPVWVEVYFDTISPPVAQVVDANDNTIFYNATSVTVDANEISTTYYWRVDTYIYGSPTGEPTAGNEWSFTTTDDPPVVDAGPDWITWVNEPAGPLTATAEDDLGPEGLSYLWSADEADFVIFEPGADVLNPTVTITSPIPAPPTVVNDGFEDPVLADGDWTEGIDGTPGWSQSQQGNINNLYIDSTVYFGAGALNPDTATYGYEAPVGENIGYMGSSNNPRYTCLKQIIPATLTANMQYDLSVLVGNPQAYNVSKYNPDGVAPDYQIALVAGSVRVAYSSGFAPADASWKRASLSFTPDGSHAQLGQQLEIWLIGYPLNDEILDPEHGSNSGGYELDFDDVELLINGSPTVPPSVELTLAVDDGANTPVEDTMTIYVGDDVCGASIISGLVTDAGDVNADCITDLEDVAAIASEWLDDYSLTEPVEKPLY